VKKYETTNHTPEALFRLVEAYLSIGLSNQAKAAAATLGHNYAETYWYKQVYALMQSHDLDTGIEKNKKANKSA
jgi:outer membrane protein assembly factor BamD